MFNFMNKLIMSPAEDGQGGSSGGTPPKAPESQTPPAASSEKTDPPPQGEGDSKFDQFGYEKPAPEGDKKPEGEGTKPDEKPAVKVEKPSTGYDKEPPKITEEVPPPAEPPPVDLGYELKFDEIVPKDETVRLKEFAKKHSLTKEAAQDLVDSRTNEFKRFAANQVEAEKNYKAEIAKTRSNWHQELKTDPAFGGDKFEHNVMQAEKVLQEFMPATKKALTDRGSMLPPYVMRDLAKLADHLYSTENFNKGEPSTPPPEPKKEKNDPLAFYQ